MYIENQKEETGGVYINPTNGLKAEDYELGFRIDGAMEECACGRQVQAFFTVSEILANQKDEFGYNMEDEHGNKMKKKKKFWESHNYPETHCHCRCGKSWKKHLL